MSSNTSRQHDRSVFVSIQFCFQNVSKRNVSRKTAPAMMSPSLNSPCLSSLTAVYLADSQLMSTEQSQHIEPSDPSPVDETVNSINLFEAIDQRKIYYFHFCECMMQIKHRINAEC